MMSGRLFVSLLALAAPFGSMAAAPGTEKMLAPPPSRAPEARVTLAPYRYDDILWENDRTAHRIYGHALESAQPPSGSGIDAWGKSVRWPYMDRQLRTGDQHASHGEGLDFYDVGTGRGAGGLGIWHDNKLWTSRNYRKVRVLNPGPKIASFEVDYAPWPVDVGRNVAETRRFTLPLGTSFTRMVSTLSSNRPGPLLVAIGIGKHTTGPGSEEVLKDAARGILSVWSASLPEKGAMGIALLVDPRKVVEIREDADHYLVILRVKPGVPFVYYSGAAWDRGPDFQRHDEWAAYVRAQRPDFDPRR
jgi:hypothetical protein